MLVPLTAICCCICSYYLPSTMPKGSLRAGLKKIDYWGVTTASVSLILLLIPISGGGSYFEWKSPMVISMLTVGGIVFIAFIFIEWRVAALPMLPSMSATMVLPKPMAHRFCSNCLQKPSHRSDSSPEFLFWHAVLFLLVLPPPVLPKRTKIFTSQVSIHDNPSCCHSVLDVSEPTTNL
jgi:hypothetical protein